MTKIIGGSKNAKRRARSYISKLKSRPIRMKYDGFGMVVQTGKVEYFYESTYLNKTKKMLVV